MIGYQLGFSVEDVTPDKLLTDDLHADSLDLVELTMEAEYEFDLEIPDEDVEGFTTVAECVQYIEKMVTARK
jgi:acyl carrier protein